jgi:glutamate/tyrosine decarboxylase-like PLP-dependent enzyme
MDGNGDPLQLGREEMRALGYRTVDALVDWLNDDSAPPLRRGEREELERRLASAEEGSFDDALRVLFEDVLPFGSRSAHPRFFAYVPFAGTWPGALGDFVASAANVYAGSWQEGAGATQLELELLDRFKAWVGYPPAAGGTLLSGGSLANLTAIACARETLVGAMRDDLVLYASDQAHSSIARAARVLGFRPGQLRVLPVDESMRLEPETLAAAVAADLAAGRRPFLVAANAGATSTGAVDPLDELAAVGREHGLWLHADAAYGGFAVLTERGRAQLGDLAVADSLALDPHKWLYQPYECGCLLVRDGAALGRAFELRSDYLRDAAAPPAGVNFADYGLQLSRTSRAFKLWLSLQTFGVDAFRAAIDRTLDLAEHAAERIRGSACLELVAPPSLGVVCFARDDGAVDGLVAALETSGLGLISSTRVDGREVLRICVLNHTTTERDVDAVIDFLEQAEPLATPPRDDRDAAVAQALPLFARLDPLESEAFVELSSARTVETGAHVVERWDTTRELYVVESGRADVRVGDEIVATLRAGDHFGEIGALGWGSGFARSRAADVVARGVLRLRVLDEDALATLLQRFPRLEDELRHSAHERLRRAR